MAENAPRSHDNAADNPKVLNDQTSRQLERSGDRSWVDGGHEVVLSIALAEFVSGCLFFGLCRHMKMTLSTTQATIRQAEKQSENG